MCLQTVNINIFPARGLKQYPGGLSVHQAVAHPVVEKAVAPTAHAI